jgi:HNH endonuclease
MTRKNFTLTTIKERLEHCGWQCEAKLEDGARCPAIVSKGKFECHHFLEDYLGGKPTFENARIYCKPCHAAVTSKQAPVLAKVRRQEAKDMRVKIVPYRPMQSAPMPTTERAAKRQHKTPLPFKAIYEDAK